MVDFREDKTRPQDAPMREAAMDKRDRATVYGLALGAVVLLMAGVTFAFWR